MVVERKRVESERDRCHCERGGWELERESWKEEGERWKEEGERWSDSQYDLHPKDIKFTKFCRNHVSALVKLVQTASAKFA